MCVDSDSAPPVLCNKVLNSVVPVRDRVQDRQPRPDLDPNSPQHALMASRMSLFTTGDTSNAHSNLGRLDIKLRRST
jgi:hypothetical protein